MPCCKENKSHRAVNLEKKKPPKTSISLPILIDILGAVIKAPDRLG